MKILETENLIKHYEEGTNLVRALDGVSITIEQGEFVAIVGMSGSGKSTLLHMLGGLDRPTEGKVFVDGLDIGSMSDEQLTLFRREHVGFIFQNYNLIPILTVYENISLPIDLSNQPTDHEYINKVINMLGLTEKVHNLPNTLSGGQQQRVAIARAVASKPSIILADEPTGSLDSKTSQDVLQLLKMSAKEFHQTIILITHNEQIANLADRIIHIADGKITKIDGGSQ